VAFFIAQCCASNVVEWCHNSVYPTKLILVWKNM
jgi:hypothetical protein